MRKIDKAIDHICLLPDSGGRFYAEGTMRSEYRTFHANPYTIYYRFDQTTVTIFRVLHQHQQISDYTLIEDF